MARGQGDFESRARDQLTQICHRDGVDKSKMVGYPPALGEARFTPTWFKNGESWANGREVRRPDPQSSREQPQAAGPAFESLEQPSAGVHNTLSTRWWMARKRVAH